MPAKKSKSINLLPVEEFEASNFGRILRWALSTFRIMVIITEMLVMGAFMSRFWLDAKNSDLNDSLNVAKAQVIAYEDIEKEFRANQAKLAIAKSLYSEGKNSEVLVLLSNALPADTSLISIILTGGKVQLRARSGSERSIAQLIANLGGSGIFKNIELSQVASSVDNNSVTTFTVSADIQSGREAVK